MPNYHCTNCDEDAYYDHRCKTKEKPDPCDCDNCEMIRRFGKGNYSGRCICRLCGEGWTKHRGWHCPEKKEWELPNGATIKKDGRDSYMIVAQGTCSVGYFGKDDFPAIIKALQEILGRER